MPYRKIPNTDTGRLEALRAIHTKANNTPQENLAISAENFNKLKIFLPIFQKEIEERGTALSVQSEATTQRMAAEEKCRLFVSHFYQVFNLCVAREKYKVSERAYFQLDINQESLPDIRTSESLCTWAENIISGDPKRVAAGSAEMINPSRAEVETVYNEYVTKLNVQSTKKDAYEKEQKDVENLRVEADDLIRDIWDEIEFKFRKDEPSAMRRKAKQYGVIYINRPGEVIAEEPLAAESKTEQPAPAK